MGTNVANNFFFQRYNKGITFLLCIIGFYSKYDWVVHIKDKRGEITIDNSQNILKFILKRNIIFVDKGFTLILNLRKSFSRRIKVYSISSIM